MSEVTQEAMTRACQICGCATPEQRKLDVKALLAFHKSTDQAGYERGQRETVEKIVAYLEARWPAGNYGDDWPVSIATQALKRGDWK